LAKGVPARVEEGWAKARGEDAESTGTPEGTDS
jgi:hypothetical protein